VALKSREKLEGAEIFGKMILKRSRNVACHELFLHPANVLGTLCYIYSLMREMVFMVLGLVFILRLSSI